MVRVRSVMPKIVREKFGRQAPAWRSSFRPPAGHGARRMSVLARKFRGGVLRPLFQTPVRAAYVVCVGLFLYCVGQFYDSTTGFSSLISIGDLLNETKVTALRQAPHYVYEHSSGYDGAYYVQLALYPTLDNPELTKAIDNLPYRARRILFSWVSWALGLGHPAWIVQAHALLNVLCWLALAWVLLRWFSPTSWENFLRWVAVMFSHGVCMSVRHSLVDGPSLLLVALALRWLEDGRRGAGAASLALAGLGKETSLLASGGIDFDWRAPRTWGRAVVTVALIATPLLAWMAYVRFKFGPADDPGLGNFTLPLVGYWEKLGVAWRDATDRHANTLHWATLGVVIALAAQWVFFVVRWRPAERWWRVGVAFAGMMTFLSTPVWEGYPGASTRVLLPMTLAFNVLLPRGGRWLPWLIAGNLTVAASVFEFSPPHEFYVMRGDATARAAVRVVPTAGWHGPERHLERHWRWSSGSAEMTLTNASAQPVRVALRAMTNAAGAARSLRVMAGDRLLWGETIAAETTELRLGLVLPPGETVLRFVTDRPGETVGTDPRALAFRVADLEIFVTPASAGLPP